MPAACRLEHLDRQYSIWTSAATRFVSMVGLVGPQLARPQRRTLADPGVDDDCGRRPPSSSESAANTFRHLLVVVDVECGDRDVDPGGDARPVRPSARRAGRCGGRTTPGHGPSRRTVGPCMRPGPTTPPVIRIFWRGHPSAYLSSFGHPAVGQYLASGLARRAVLK